MPCSAEVALFCAHSGACCADVSLCSPWHLVCTAARLSPGLRPPPLCRCAVHTKRQGCVLEWFVAIRWIANRFARAACWFGCGTSVDRQPLRRSWSAVYSAQRHEGGVAGHRPARGTAAELSTPSACSRTRLSQSLLRATNATEVAPPACYRTRLSVLWLQPERHSPKPSVFHNRSGNHIR